MISDNIQNEGEVGKAPALHVCVRSHSSACSVHAMTLLPKYISVSRKLSQWYQEVRNLNAHMSDADTSENTIKLPLTLNWLTEETIPTTFERIMMFCEYYYDHPFALRVPAVGTLKERVDTWYLDFITSFSDVKLALILKTSHFLQIDPLTHLGCAYIAEYRLPTNPRTLESLFSLVPCFEEEDIICAVQNTQDDAL